MTQPQIALVTGGAKGLGAAIARHLAAMGYVVIVHYRSSEKAATATLAAVRRQSPESSMISADLRSATDVDALIGVILQRYGRLDVLVHTVGNFVYKKLSAFALEEWKEVMETNLQSTFLLTQAALPHMQHAQYGRIILFGCAGADRFVTHEHTTPYYIAKTGVVMLTKQLASEYAPFGVTVNCISPGVLTSSHVKVTTPTGRAIPFVAITRTVSFLLAEESQYINGANIEVADGWLV